MILPLCSIAIEEKRQIRLKIFDVNDNRCRYHPLRNKCKEINLTSDGVCPFAYSNLYPILLALHCNEDRLRLRMGKQCPMGPGGISFNIYSIKRKLGLFKQIENIIRRLINLVIPFEIHNKNIVMEVVDEGRGCPLGMKKGDKYYFNIDNKNELCPAAFYSVYPFLDFIHNNIAVGCPDYRTHVRFTSGDNNEDIIHNGNDKCDKYGSKVKIIRMKGTFHCPVKIGQWYLLDDLIAELGIRCYTSFHTAFPYLYVLTSGGQLGYLTHNRKKAGICCPNTVSNVRYVVAKDPSGNYGYQCIQTHGECPRRIILNEQIFLKKFEEALPFYIGLSEIYTSLRKIDVYKVKNELPLQMEILSKDGDNELLWLISRDI